MATASVALRLLLEQTDWSALRICGGYADATIPLLLEFVTAETADLADVVYGNVTNAVVLQGSHFEATEAFVPVLLELAMMPVSTESRHLILDLLVEIGYGAPHPSELERGNNQLGVKCLGALRSGLAFYYHLLGEADPRIRLDALDLIDAVEDDRARVRYMATWFARNDEDTAVRAGAESILEDLHKVE